MTTLTSNHTGTHPATKRRVLVVDDEDNVTHLVSSALPQAAPHGRIPRRIPRSP